MGNESSQSVTYAESLPNNITVSWKKATSNNHFPAREGQCCCGHDKSFYIFGGVLQSKSEPEETNDLLAFDIGTTFFFGAEQGFIYTIFNSLS